MISDSIRKIRIVSAPKNWEVIQHTNGYADFEVKGVFENNADDDTWQDMPFSTDRLYVRITNESDGSLAMPLIRVECDSQNWSASVCGLECGGPYTLDVVLFDSDIGTYQPTRGANIRHFCVGDVFLIAGQSNAAGMGLGTVTDEPEFGVHVFRNLDFWDIATAPFNDYDYSKHNMFLSFAKKLKKLVGHPVGLVPAAMGGAPLSRWLVDENGDLYNKMTKAVVEGGIKFNSVLWYQGCTDAGDGVSENEYVVRFKKLTQQFRTDFSLPDMKFFTFQLNRQRRRDVIERLDRSYDEIREAQRRCAHEIENVYVIPTVDCTHMSDFIHCSKLSHIMLGERLADLLAHTVYGKGRKLSFPEPETAILSSDKSLCISFSGVEGYLQDLNAPLSDYPIVVEDKNGKKIPEKVNISGNRVELCFSDSLEMPVYVSGQCSTNPQNILIDYVTQLPMLCFYKFGAE